MRIAAYPAPLIAALEASLSKDRLQSYLTAAGGEETQALQLYIWNTQLSAALYQPLQGLEITLRNAFHRQLSLTYGNDWYDQIPQILSGRSAVSAAPRGFMQLSNGRAMETPSPRKTCRRFNNQDCERKLAIVDHQQTRFEGIGSPFLEGPRASKNRLLHCRRASSS